MTVYVYYHLDIAYETVPDILVFKEKQDAEQYLKNAVFNDLEVSDWAEVQALIDSMYEGEAKESSSCEINSYVVLFSEKYPGFCETWSIKEMALQ